MTNPMQAKKRAFKDHKAKHFLFETDADGRVATITLNRPEKKNPLTFESYEELYAYVLTRFPAFPALGCELFPRAYVPPGGREDVRWLRRASGAHRAIAAS